MATKLCVCHSILPRCRKYSSRMWTTAIHAMKNPQGGVQHLSHTRTLQHIGPKTVTGLDGTSDPGVSFSMLTKILQFELLQTCMLVSRDPSHPTTPDKHYTPSTQSVREAISGKSSRHAIYSLAHSDRLPFTKSFPLPSFVLQGTVLNLSCNTKAESNILLAVHWRSSM